MLLFMVSLFLFDFGDLECHQKLRSYGESSPAVIEEGSPRVRPEQYLKH